MAGDPTKFPSLSKRKCENVTFDDNSKKKIVGIGNIDGNSSPLIGNVLLIDNPKHNLLSIIQLCEKGYKVIFEVSKCWIEHALDEKLSLVGCRLT